MRRTRIRQLSNPYLFIEQLLLEALGECETYVSGIAADLGCGDFRLSKGFIKRTVDLIGIDNWLPARFHTRVPDGARFYYGSVHEAPLQDGAFDTVLCTEVLEHVDVPEQLMAECCRVLKPGGHAIVSVPFSFFVHGAPNDFRRYTIYGLDRLIDGAGLQVVSYLHVGSWSHVLLNHLITRIGFARDVAGSRLKRLMVIGVNLLGKAMLKSSAKPVVHTTLDPALNDRTQPLGYVIVARKPIEQVASPKHGDAVVCPACHGTLSFAAESTYCQECSASFPHFEGTPVLASPDQLHLVMESTGVRIEF